MTAQPRDLAAEVERIRPLLSDASPQDVETLLAHIAALTRELEELRAPVTAENYGPTLAADINALPDRLRRYVIDLEQRADPAWDVRRAFAAEEKAMALEVRVQELEAKLTALRRPVEQSAEVEAIRREWADDMQTLAEAESCGIPADLDGDSPFRDSAYTVRYLLSALDQAQREIETLKRCLLQAQNAAIELAHSHTCFICSGDGQIEGKKCDACSGIGEYLRDGESFIECIKRNRSDAELALKLYADEKLKTEGLSQQIARLTSPPEERGEIVERQACRKDCLANGDAFGAVIATRDIDVLLQDLRRYSNAHAILLAERDEARGKCARLEQQQLGAKALFERIERLERHQSEAHAAIAAAAVETTARIKQLESALRRIDAIIDSPAAFNSEIQAVLRAALADSQHTAGSGDGVAGD